MRRREFIQKIGRTALALPIVVTAIAACGDDDDGGGSADANTSGGCASPQATIGSNHSHTMTVSAADVTAGAEKEYDIQGTSGHPHSVTLTVADFTQLQSGSSVTKTSTSGGSHTHSVTISC
jgi:hypothetical protein